MLSPVKRTKMLGLTVIELLVVLAINTIILSALLGVFIANVNHYTKVINTNRLNQQLQMAMDLMVNDIRRAGYSSTASNDIGTGQNNNPFMATGTDVSVNADNNCILFTYDHGDSGSLPAVSSSYDDSRYGFRLNEQAVQTRPPGATFSCTAGNTEWENITDTNTIHITELTFTLNTSTITTGPGTQGITFRSVDIVLTGQLANDPAIVRTLNQHVRIRNDKFIP